METSRTLVELNRDAYGEIHPNTMVASADLVYAYQISGRLKEGSDLAARDSRDMPIGNWKRLG